MTRMGIATNVFGAASSAMAAPSAPGQYPRFGMAMRFSVVVNGGSGPTNLGSWSSCGNLGLTLKPEEHRQGGNYEYAELFPGEITYQQVTLERAVEPKSADAVQDWLRSVVSDWINAEEGGSTKNPRQVGSTVTITLFSAYDGKPVQTWRLRNAIPVSWTGPSLNATSEQIATEKLVLVHEGFLDPKTTSRAGASSPAGPNQGKLTLCLSTKPTERVVFDYTPAQVGLGKMVTIRSPALARTIEQQVVDPGKLSVTCGDLRVEGKSKVKETVDQLLEWLEPAPGPPSVGGLRPKGSKWLKAVVAAPKTVEEKSAAKKLRLTMGVDRAGLSRLMVLKSVNVTYTRFTKTGAPSRAKISITLEETHEREKGTNPTSGTPEPSQVCIVVGGDSLPGIAQRVYGDPSEWRAVAEANGVDDPMRMAAGQVIALPRAKG